MTVDDLLRNMSESTGTLALRLLAAENDLAEARAWMHSARIELCILGAIADSREAAALAERCPLPKEDDDAPV